MKKGIEHELEKTNINRLELHVKYYESLYADSCNAVTAVAKMKGEIKERLIEAKQQLERAKSVAQQGHNTEPARRDASLLHADDVGSDGETT
jgi:hypothetical protein